jgi:hypothetical protein
VTCPICKNEVATIDDSLGDFSKVNCQRCGPFKIAGSTKIEWQDAELTEQQIANASSWIRENAPGMINKELFEKLKTLKSPSVADRGAKLLIRIEQLTQKLGEWLAVNIMSNPDLLGVSWSTKLSEVQYLLDKYLQGEIQCVAYKFSSPSANVMITPRGYAYLDSLRSINPDSQIGFCAMWFDESVRNIWTDAIRPAIEDAGYKPVIMHEHNNEHNNKIDDEMIAMIRRSKFMIVDFTHGKSGMRGGVYYEAGYAEGLGLKVICTCRKDLVDNNEIHFDNRQSNFILWEDGKSDELRKAVQMRIERTIGKGPSLLEKVTPEIGS